jgi:hypothetical protein
VETSYLRNLSTGIENQEEGKSDPASHLVKVSTSNISNQQYLRFAERETKDKQEQGKLAIVLKL